MSASTQQVGKDRIEHASRDEIQALQLERMKWSLKHAYDNVPHYRKAFDEAGVHPSDLKQLSDLSLAQPAQGSRPSAFRHPAVSEGVGTHGAAQRWCQHVRASGTARG